MGKEGWSRLDGWGAKWARPWAPSAEEEPMEALGRVGGHEALASPEQAERVRRCERLAALGLLGADEWMGTSELAEALARPAED